MLSRTVFMVARVVVSAASSRDPYMSGIANAANVEMIINTTNISTNVNPRRRMGQSSTNSGAPRENQSLF
jgi:hypothetical protein